MNRADFYIGVDKKSKWVGSLLNNGHPMDIPTKILLIKNKVEYEESIVSLFNNMENAVIAENRWPHLWNNSTFSDYSYHLFSNKVWCSMMGKQMFDPLVVISGGDLIQAEECAPKIKIEYPLMDSTI